MPRKRKGRNKIQHFYCPHCESRLWRMNSPKHFLFYTGASEIRQKVRVTLASAIFLASKGDYIDTNSWIEEFYCSRDGNLWMKVTRKTDGTQSTNLASQEDWKRTTYTIQPNMPNPSVSEFTYRMSRQNGIRYYEKL
ncbi:MAG: hypothetical protein JOZ78_05605 [Chroococcidiopsidaceae cyanobacterium CP_BM_ER_R8_30]|nr:hypothetical protein [Chroococcidiopsidaceae cyanobacterium CP_BM_ER_R8_30]